ncbi:MAG: hypothetical protein PHP92_03485 [Candidatus Nanoarchaeia archaeon]|nr:hypothetical protein [Candidatus Nanoarchaeia archaeon]
MDVRIRDLTIELVKNIVSSENIKYFIQDYQKQTAEQNIQSLNDLIFSIYEKIKTLE